MADVSAIDAAWIGAAAAMGGAGFTVLGTLLSNRAAYRVAALQSDQASREQRRSREFAVAEALRSDRIEAHESALRALTELWHAVYDVADQLTVISDAHPIGEVPDSMRSRALKAVTHVAFIAGDDAAQACLHAHEGILDAERETRNAFLRRGRDQLTMSQTYSKLDQAAVKVTRLLNRYRDSAREEIGTS